MRKMVIALLVLGLTAIAVAPAGAVSLLTETFAYANGNLVPNGGWATHSGSGTDIAVASGAALGNMANAPDDNRTFTAQSATAKTYYCFNVMIPSNTVPVLTNYFIHFKDTGTANFYGRCYVMPSASKFTFGLSVGSCNASLVPPCFPTAWPGTLNFDQWYTVVVSYDAAAGSSELWVDPSSELDAKITHSTWSGSTSQAGGLVSAIALRQPSSNSGFTGSTWMYDVDNLGVGTTFNDACTSAPVPTNKSTWGRVKTLYR